MAAHSLVLYGKADCHLCHEARDLLMRLQAEYPFTLDEVNITRDPALEARYFLSIPVIVVDGTLELEAPVHESEVRAALRR